MDSSEHKELLAEIASLRKEIRSTRRWAICAVVLVAILLTPAVLAFLAGLGDAGNVLLQILGAAAFFLVAAFVVAQFSKPAAKVD